MRHASHEFAVSPPEPATVSGPGAKRPNSRAESRETAKTMSVMGRNAAGTEVLPEVAWAAQYG